MDCGVLLWTVFWTEGQFEQNGSDSSKFVGDKLGQSALERLGWTLKTSSSILGYAWGIYGTIKMTKDGG